MKTQEILERQAIERQRLQETPGSKILSFFKPISEIKDLETIDIMDGVSIFEDDGQSFRNFHGLYSSQGLFMSYIGGILCTCYLGVLTEKIIGDPTYIQSRIKIAQRVTKNSNIEIYTFKFHHNGLIHHSPGSIYHSHINQRTVRFKGKDLEDKEYEEWERYSQELKRLGM